MVLRGSNVQQCVVLISCLLLLPSSCTASSLPTEVVQLTDRDFEDRTQASTGQTTGVWCVLFQSGSHPRYSDERSAFELLAADEDKDVIYAAVDLDRTPQLKARFGGLVPGVLLFKRQSMYRLPGGVDDIAATEAAPLKAFAESSYMETEQLTVPKKGPAIAHKAADEWKEWHMLDEGNIKGFYLIGFCIALVMMAIPCFFMSQDADKRSREAAAQAAAIRASPAAAAAAALPAQRAAAAAAADDALLRQLVSKKRAQDIAEAAARAREMLEAAEDFDDVKKLK